MSIKEVKKAMIDDGNDIYFMHNGRKAGISTTVKNSVFVFNAWYGSDTKEFNSFDEAIHAKFFGGDSIIDLVNTTDIYFC